MNSEQDRVAAAAGVTTDDECRTAQGFPVTTSAGPTAGRVVFPGWYVVAATFVLLFAGFGTTYSFGAFFLPLSASFDATRAEISAVFAYATALIFSVGAVSGHLADRYGPRRIAALGTLASVLGLVLGAHADSLTGVTLSFTLGLGLGVGCVYVPAIGTVQRWFVRRRALASGVAVTGIGLGTLVVPLLVGHLLEWMSWREVFVWLAAAVALLCWPASAALFADPRQRGLHADGHTPSAVPPAAHLPEPPAHRAMLLSRPFIQLYLAQCLMSFVILMPFVHVVPYAEDQGIAGTSAVLMLSLIGAGSTAGRIVLGLLADRLGRKPTLTALFAAIGLCYALWANAHSMFALTLFSLLFGTVYGGVIALMPALLADYFAGPRLGAIIGLQYTSSAVGSLLGPIAAGYVFDVSGSYIPALLVGVALAAAGAALLATTPPPGLSRQAM